MSTAPEAVPTLRFACTSCGACCNRSPEVQLSEAAALADMFVFRLMFRLYDLPRTFAAGTAAASAVEYYESKRLLAAFAARQYPAKLRREGKPVDYVRSLAISALSVDTAAGACAALGAGRCTIYERRPAACRSVPFHYSRAEASAGRDLAAFVATPGYGCDTGPGAPVVLEAGRIVDSEARRARADALALAGQDRAWTQAILRRMKPGSRNCGLPGLREIEANAPFGATTVSMGVAWRIAADAGVIGAGECRSLIAAQSALIGEALAAPLCPPGERETLLEMRGEYRALLNG
jgi:Fe-S-cluster containining protein